MSQTTSGLNAQTCRVLRNVQGECLQQLAGASLEACSAQPDEALTPAMEADTRASAKALFAQSVDAYKQVPSTIHAHPNTYALLNTCPTPFLSHCANQAWRKSYVPSFRRAMTVSQYFKHAEC